MVIAGEACEAATVVSPLRQPVFSAVNVAYRTYLEAYSTLDAACIIYLEWFVCDQMVYKIAANQPTVEDRKSVV